jgi:hypothetical protein
MNFFKSILISYSRNPYWIHPYDVPDILEPFHLLLHPYSILRNLSPRNAYPNIVFLDEKIPFAKFVNSCLSFFSQYHLCFCSVGIQYACEHDLYLQPPLVSEHPHCCKPELANHDNESERHLPIPCSDTLCTKLYVHLNDSWCDFQSYFPSIKSRKICRNYKSCTESA